MAKRGLEDYSNDAESDGNENEEWNGNWLCIEIWGLGFRNLGCRGSRLGRYVFGALVLSITASMRN